MNSKKVISMCIAVSLLATLPGCGDGSDGDISYVALGASDTAGVGATPFTNGYPYLIEEDIESRANQNVDLDNLGIPGAEIGDIDNIEIAIVERKHSPDLITITTGANDIIDGDSVEGFESDLNGLFNKLRSLAPDAVIAIGNLPDLTKVERFVRDPDKDVTSQRVAGYNAAIARQAQTHRALLVDLFSVPIDESLVRDEDGFHPNDKGHRAIADAFMSVLTPHIETLKAASN